MTANGNTIDTTSFLRQAGTCKFWTATVKGIPAWRRNDVHRGASKGYMERHVAFYAGLQGPQYKISDKFMVSNFMVGVNSEICYCLLMLYNQVVIG